MVYGDSLWRYGWTGEPAEVARPTRGRVETQFRGTHEHIVLCPELRPAAPVFVLGRAMDAGRRAFCRLRGLAGTLR
jgi:hypothetical protein